MNCTSRAMLLIATVASCLFSAAQTTNVYTSSTTWTVPSGVNSISIKVYGGAGGTGGRDCGGCSNAAAGPVGYQVAAYTVSPGDVVGIYPGGKGADGANSASGYGGGAGGIATYSSSYNGGVGGNAGDIGSSGAGGGGGAASLVTINSTIKMVAGGAGGGGGGANFPNTGKPGTSATSPNGSNTFGGAGTSTIDDDGGGGGGGGGGQLGSIGGIVSFNDDAGEWEGEGGYRGGNSISGAASTTTNGFTTWTTAGRIEITYTSTLPVTWLDFTAQKHGNQIQLNWSTATEQNAKEFELQKSTNGRDWSGIGSIPAAGNSVATAHYHFTDAKPSTGLNFYRLLQRDIDLRVSYSKVVLLDWAHPGKGLRVYPNPTPTGIVNLYLDKRSTVHLFNSSGHKLSEWELDAGLHTLNLSNRPKGMYYLKTPAGEIRLLWK